VAPGLDDLERWAAGARAQEAADQRVRERWLRQAAEEEASFAGLLADLAEAGRAVVVTTTSGRRHQGPVVAVGWDFVALSPHSGAAGEGRLTLLNFEAIAELRQAPGSAPRASVAPARPPTGPGDREGGLGVTLVEVLAQAVAVRPRVAVVLGAVTVVGQLRAVGADVLSVKTDTEPGGLSYSRLSSVSEISLFDSG
jgi:hypothetical protein